MPETMSIAEVGKMIGANDRGVRNWVRLGRLQPRRNWRGKLVFRRDEVLKAWEKYEFGPPKEEKGNGIDPRGAEYG